jgi:hypothetical protein
MSYPTHLTQYISIANIFSGKQPENLSVSRGARAELSVGTVRKAPNNTLRNAFMCTKFEFFLNFILAKNFY